MWQDQSDWWCEKRDGLESYHKFTHSLKDNEELHNQICKLEI